MLRAFNVDIPSLTREGIQLGKYSFYYSCSLQSSSRNVIMK